MPPPPAAAPASRRSPPGAVWVTIRRNYRPRAVSGQQSYGTGPRTLREKLGRDAGRPQETAGV